MAKLIFGIIALIVLAVGVVMIFGNAVFYPEKQFAGDEKSMNHKRTRLKLIGYVVCMFAFLIGIIISLF